MPPVPAHALQDAERVSICRPPEQESASAATGECLPSFLRGRGPNLKENRISFTFTEEGLGGGG
jgi:hypothetical protein